MPAYEYGCPKCKKVLEIRHAMSDEPEVLCCEESCGDIKMERLISKSSFQLRGMGWASDGYSKTGVD